jgi:hypothetical protein
MIREDITEFNGIYGFVVGARGRSKSRFLPVPWEPLHPASVRNTETTQRAAMSRMGTLRKRKRPAPHKRDRPEQNQLAYFLVAVVPLLVGSLGLQPMLLIAVAPRTRAKASVITFFISDS